LVDRVTNTHKQVLCGALKDYILAEV